MVHALRRTTSVAALAAAAALALTLSSCRDDTEAAGERTSTQEPAAQAAATADPQSLTRDVMAAPLDNPVLDYSGTYVVTSIFRGDGECLDANTGQADAAHGGAFLAGCDGSDAQRWQIRTISPGIYQLVSGTGDQEVCLNSNDRDSPVHDGAAFSEECRNIANQAWTIELAGEGVLHLHSRLYADSFCLESNEAGSEVHAGSVFMDDCQEVSGQYWYLKNA